MGSGKSNNGGTLKGGTYGGGVNISVASPRPSGGSTKPGK